MNPLLDFFSPPVFPDDEERTRAAYYLHIVALALLGVLSLLLIIRLASGTSLLYTPNLIFLGIIVIIMAAFILQKNNYTQMASHVVLSTLWIAATLLAIYGNGAAGNQAARYIVIAAFAGLISGYQTAIGVSLISIVGIAVVSYFQSIGMIQQQPESALVAAMQAIIPLILSAIFIYLSISSLQKAIKASKERSLEFEKNNKELRTLEKSLEVKVQERTDDLIKANLETKRRATQFQTLTQVAQKIASERDLDTLLSIITEVISDQFGYYHAAIYLNDDIQEFTILSAASSKEGKQMLQRGYQLPIKQSSLVGYVAKTGTSRSSSEAGEFAYISGTEMSATRSQYALPLKAGNLVIGVLDVQSDKDNAFDQTDLEALTALANQTTIAIQNTRLFAETQTALAESQLLYGTVIKQTWKSTMHSSPQVGYRYTGVKPVPLQKELDTPEIRSALENDDVAVTQPSKRRSQNALAVPLKLRESTIGVINVNFPLDTEVGEDEIDVLLAASQRIALALENASLLEESQRRAKREQTISEMSTKIGAGTEIDTILKTAIQELSSHISSAQIMIELNSEEG